jgi:hypothetical protein
MYTLPATVLRLTRHPVVSTTTNVNAAKTIIFVISADKEEA